MPMLRRLSVALLVMWMVWPVSSHAQAVKAGVISTVSGKVTAIRAGLAQPLPLKFKDDVFLQDRIATGEQSLARVLLGGKALVTIRELSVLTITEVPGQATINLESGKIGLAVARDRMRPGESIEVRTPNAVAAVRGTVLITETDRAAGQIPRTAMYLTSDPSGRGVGVTHLNPATGLPIGLPATLAGNLGFFATGADPLSVRQMTEEDHRRARAGLEDYVPPHLQAANQQQLTQAQLREATQLVNTLNEQPPPTTTVAGALSSQNAVEQAQEEQNSTSAIGVFVAAATIAATATGGSSTSSDTFTSTGCSSPPCAGLSGNPSLFFSTNLPSVTLSPSVLSPSSFPASSSTTPGAPATPFGAGALTNGSFESGLTGWTSTGAASTLAAFGPFTPSDSLMALIHTQPPATGLGVSTLSQAFTLGSTTLTKLKFSYNFFTNEFPTQTVNDFFRAKLISPTAAETILAFESRLGSAFTGTTSAISVGGITISSGSGYTGFINLSIPLLLTPGTWTLFFEVRNVSDSAFDSAALIDVVQVVPDPPLYFLFDGRTMTRTDPAPLLRLVSSPQTFDALLV
ncbi:MAG: FecR domain-containing protein, partial [Candidatus Rokubacteria bacterium]|nr:FecR domain-containing protein [Candidatus Rokubacteria bacterium]